MKTIAIIPARMGSSRFPGKPLAKLLGRTMLEHVYKRVALSDALDATYIATCDEEIQQTAEAFGASVIMTSDKHERASDRVAEAIAGLDAELIVMVQGDEPMTHPRMIDTAVAPFRTDPQLGCVNLVRRIENEADFYDVNTIKVIMNQRGDALYMSRQPIPTLAKSGFASTSAYKQVCIIPFRRATLLHYTQLPTTPLEQLESIDMLRLLEHNIRVKMVETEFNSQAVDTEADLARVSKLMEPDPLLSSY
ncbi:MULTISPECIES: 3-deoxy-manno-octulosonate cytidylyltransferase [Nitrosomonas]|uniref:3-deoxy-manno-octulosonate cytidylyltransferase n=1 Tax=Nitrosomonas communis TaxID=44574 RepID=A0A0F7KES1_9PROT|nr:MULTISPECIES: 3-deoxy-manno-octulosonate cytidylyltransferase [Nitrosomonas]AKH38950.1 3-deoxy-manno-octulosonate cytidylyltransferase [Nitrosomonas communis]TYP82099.1 3-deoxy-manno-octulosonate cytidylyltransferase (CMP-KDO synthetase) [Nitrosomonas communis]UVS61099.1 3-deoxy-manno-octulosonate cytidylyltransferase [Nitrosomonas sp. PLL12]SDV99403.1 3-deoxy-manno-octulosonate cytidylyltransferase (CMP-KDO synthetase) [Nitrosomonas communis]